MLIKKLTELMALNTPTQTISKLKLQVIIEVQIAVTIEIL